MIVQWALVTVKQPAPRHGNRGHLRRLWVLAYTSFMEQSLTFSRAKLADYLACQRRYQLRYNQQLAWPASPLNAATAGALAGGRQFHRLLQRHFLGLPMAQAVADEPALAGWWRRFQSSGPELPAGRRLPELSLTVPIGGHFLTGRFDLLIAGADSLHIYDWKTEIRPRSQATLRDDLQTRVYLALAAEGAASILNPIRPEAIKLTYWYATDPPIAVTFAYDQPWHAENWTFLLKLVSEIAEKLAHQETLPLTGDLDECRRCAYQAYCGRQVGGFDLIDWQEIESAPHLEPDLP